MCMIDNSEPYAVYQQRDSKARKAYTCELCRIRIAVGESYRRDAGLYDGHWSVFRYCRWCADNPLAWLVAECGGYCNGGEHEDLEEHRDEMSCRGSFEEWMEWARTVVGLRRRLRQVSAS